MSTQIIGVIGQGTMGAGIAQVAAQNNCKVIAFDTNEAILQTATNNLKNTLIKLAEKGKISAEQQRAIFNNITYTTDIQQLAERNQENYVYFLEKGPQCEAIKNPSKARTMAFRSSAMGLTTEITFQQGLP